MALTIDTTIGGETSNSYVSLAYCDDFWAQHYSATKASQWQELSDAQKTLTLIAACRVIETVRFTTKYTLSISESQFDPYTRRFIQQPEQPTKYYSTQALQFPRNLDVNTSNVLVIPDAVKMAQCEQAVYLLAFDDGVLASKLQGLQTENMAVAGISMAQTIASLGTSLAPMAMEYLRPYILKLSNSMRRG